MPNPRVEWLNPGTLYVDDTYQRTPTEKSLRLVRKVAAGGFSWRKFQPPSVTYREVDGVVRAILIDGQHTAMMALTRGVEAIPCIIVEMRNGVDEIDAFVGQNLDKTNLTSLNKHRAKVAAGDDDALTVNQVCERAGVILVGYQKPADAWAPGETMAIGAITALVHRRIPLHARQVLDVCVKAQLTPIKPAEIYAVEALLFGDEFRGLIKPDALVDIMLTDPTLARDASAFQATKRVPYWRALTAEIYKRASRRARAA